MAKPGSWTPDLGYTSRAGLGSVEPLSAGASAERSILGEATRAFATAIALLAAAAVPVEPQDLIDRYAAHIFTDSDGTAVPYRLFVPENTAGEPLPLVVYLHGAGGGGADNRQQLSRGNVVPLALFASSELQARHPAFVVAPQSPYGWSAPGWHLLSKRGQAVVELVEALSRQYDIDRDRVYLTGMSMGGHGTWDIARKRPDLFAAAVPSCSAGNPSEAASLRDVAVWAFHGAQDVRVPVSGSRDMVEALRALGSSARYTEYPDAGHDACTFPYRDSELAEWLFQQRRRAQPTATRLTR